MSQTSKLKRTARTWIGTISTIAPLAIALLIALPSPAFAGGFQLSVETPNRSNDPKLTDVVLVARTYGCHQPADAKLSATAEGLVGGKRQSLPVELRSIESGGYAIKQQWPAEGTWVLALTGDYNGMTCSVMIELGPAGKVLPGTRLAEGNPTGVHAKSARRKWVAADIDSALRTTAGTTSQTSDEPESALSPLKAISLLLGGLGAVVAGGVARSRRKRAHAEL
jgi:hypothetical protein